MRKIRFLLLLLVTIVTQGAWAQECTHQNLAHYPSTYDCLKGGNIEYWLCESCYTAFKDADCTQPFDGNTYKYPVESHDFDFSKGTGIYHCQNEYCNQEVLDKFGAEEVCISNDGIATPFNENRYGTYYKTASNYPLYRFVSPRTGKLVIKDVTEIEYTRTPIAIAVFNSNWEFKDYKSGNNYEAIEFSCDVEQGQEYFIGIRAKGANEKLLDETFTIDVYCSVHQNIEHHGEVLPTCYQGGNWGYFVCNDCGGTFSYTDPGTACDVNDFILPQLTHNFKDGKCDYCDYEVQTLSLTKNDEGTYSFEGDVDYDSKSAVFETPCTLFRVYVPEHGDLTANAFVDSENGVEFMEARLFENEDWLGGAMAKGRRTAADPSSFVYMERTVGAGWMYIVVYNSELDVSKLQIYLTPHELSCLKEHVDATCTKDGCKAVYECLDPSCGWIFAEDGSFDTENTTIPAVGHNEDETGVCTRCNQRLSLAVGENTITFPAGENKKTAFKYIATETNRIDVMVDTEAQVNVEIMTWDEWDYINNNDGPIYSAKGRRAAEEPEPKVAISKIVKEGVSYAIVFTTTTEEAVTATVKFGISEITCPDVTVGENTIKVAAADIIWGDYYNPKTFNIYPFKPTESGIAHIYTVGDHDSYGVLFDYKLNMITDNDDMDEANRNLGINIPVEKGVTYYIGVREYSGDYIGNYTLIIELEGLSTHEGTLEFATVRQDGEVTEKNPAETIDNFFDGRDVMFTVLGGVTYKRNATTSRWGTVMLPYRLYSNDDVTYYELTSVGNSEMTFSPVEAVASNTPTVYRFNNEASSYQYDASTTGPTDVLWYGNELNSGSTKVDYWGIIGFYNEYKIEDPSELSQVRYISHDKFMKATSSLTIPAYRAFFVTRNDDALSAKSFTITVEGEGTATDIKAIMTEDGIEDIDAIYDIKGSKLSSMKRGVNIIRTADGKVRKVINK